MLGLDERQLNGVLLAGKYRIEKRLGVGGMGEVYRATNETIGRKVAVKVLHPEMLRNSDIVERFLREAKAATIVRHPNVVDVLDVLTHDDVPFIVQELLNGEDLSNFVERRGGKLPLDELCSVMIPVVEAVGLAHSKGVVHRDLKPENVFLHIVEGQLIPKVLDFGISKITVGDSKKVTTTGTAMGTPAYMSPEQIQSLGGVDARSDVWALGVILYELASGVRPFDGETPGAMFVQACTMDPRPLSTVLPGISAEFAEITRRCIRRDREERYRDAREMSRALRAYCLHQGFDPAMKLQEVAEQISSHTERNRTDPEAHQHRVDSPVAAPSSAADQQATLAAKGPALKAPTPADSAPSPQAAYERAPTQVADSSMFSSVAPAVEQTQTSVAPLSRSRAWIPVVLVGAIAVGGFAMAARTDSHRSVTDVNLGLVIDAGAEMANAEDSSPPVTLHNVQALQNLELADTGVAIAQNAVITEEDAGVVVGQLAQSNVRIRRNTNANNSNRQQNTTQNTASQPTGNQTGSQTGTQTAADPNNGHTRISHGTSTYE